VAHHDIKSGNILIDASKGGKLLLADFGTSVKPGEECTGFTRSYAPSELLASYELDDYSDLR
jgi:serine/threonine protein kinase